MKLSDSERELLISEMFTISLINTDLASYMNEDENGGCENNEI